jgi:hypothetical protein
MQKNRLRPIKICIGKKYIFSLIIQVGSNLSIFILKALL